MMIEPVYNDAVVIVIEAAAEIEIGRIVEADGGVVVILVGLSYLLINVVFDIEIERFLSSEILKIPSMTVSPFV